MSAIAMVPHTRAGARSHLEPLLESCGGIAGAYVAAATVGGVGISAAPGTSFATSDGLACAAQGAIYRRRALAATISPRCRARIEARGGIDRVSPAEVMLAIYESDGEDALAAVDGEFAFALWDGPRGRLLCGRDFVGLQSLYVAECTGVVLVATRAAALRAHPAYQHRLDLDAIGGTIAGLFNVELGTGSASVWPIRTGELLVIERDGRRTSRIAWPVPAADPDVQRLGFDDAAAELRARLESAVAERLAPSGRTTVWLSGGWDSSAVFASGMRVLAGGNGARDLAPLSMSYPEGDPGREDELIAQAAAAHGHTPRWCLIADTPLLPGRPRAGRDGAFAHAYEEWNRAMARATRAVPSAVAMIGMGGDELFSGTTIYLSDLLRHGQLLTLARQWYHERGRTLRRFPELVLRPAATRAASGMGITPPWQFWNQASLPGWLRGDFVRRQQLVERERDAAPRTRGDLADAEMEWLLTAPMFARIRSALGEVVADEGVQLRAPLFDRRLVAFARARPRSERVSDGQTKRLLRHAMRGSLPASFLAPRTRRTGVTTGYLLHGMRVAGRDLITDVFAAPLLAELGVVDRDALRRAWENFRERGSSLDALALYQTYAAELWVREQLGAAVSAAPVLERGRTELQVSTRTPHDLVAVPAASLAGRSAQPPISPEGW